MDLSSVCWQAAAALGGLSGLMHVGLISPKQQDIISAADRLSL